MMLYPSIDKLLEKVNSRYSIIMLASKRAHQLDEEELDSGSKKNHKNTVVRALEEIATGELEIDKKSK